MCGSVDQQPDEDLPRAVSNCGVRRNPPEPGNEGVVRGRFVQATESLALTALPRSCHADWQVI